MGYLEKVESEKEARERTLKIDTSSIDIEHDMPDLMMNQSSKLLQTGRHSTNKSKLDTIQLSNYLSKLMLYEEGGLQSTASVGRPD